MLLGGYGGGGSSGIPGCGKTISATNPNKPRFEDPHNIFNESERAVLCSSDYAFYKGALVIKADLTGFLDGTAASFGIIVMDTDIACNQAGIRMVKHEYGHFLHFKQIGAISYFSNIVIPSVAGAVLDHLDILPYGTYYNLPWEHIAEHLGDVNRRGYAEWADDYATAYWIWTIMTDIPG